MNPEFDVTGLIYTIGAGLSRDDAKAAVRDFSRPQDVCSFPPQVCVADLC